MQASPDGLRAVLQAMGAFEASTDLDAAIVNRERSLWSWRLDPVSVAWEGTPVPVELRLPESAVTGGVDCRLELENGETSEWQEDLESLKRLDRAEIAGESFVAVGLSLLGRLPLGYHRLHVELQGRHLHATVIAAPKQAYERSGASQRDWGVFMPTYALRSQRSWGAGDLTDLSALVDWTGAKGGRVVGTLPLLAAFLDEPLQFSPYSPVSRLFWNELFIDPRAGVASTAGADPETQAMLAAAEKQARALDKEPLVAYREVMALKRRVLEAQARAFFDAPLTERAAYERFLQSRPEVADYARFRGAMQKLGPSWQAWPERQRTGKLKAEDADPAVERYHAYVQWRVEAQMQALAQNARARDVDLYLDLPVGVHGGGYDAWRYAGLFAPEIDVGAPPDVTTTSGQNWGFAPLSPEALRQSGYEYVIAFLRHHLRAAGILRIDHAMGLHRLYWIPRGAGAGAGVYVRYPSDELYAVLTLESQRHTAGIVGENLGIVTYDVNRALSRHRIGRMYVLCIEVEANPQQPFHRIPREVVASVGTHDLPAFAAYWKDADLEERVRLGVLNEERARLERATREQHRKALVAYLQQRGLLGADYEIEEVYRGCLTILAESPARRVIVNLEDLWLETQPQNIPGTIDKQHPNWRRRSRYTLEELDSLPEGGTAVELLQRLRPVESEKVRHD